MNSQLAQLHSPEWKTETGLLLSSQIMLEYNAFYLYTACAVHFDSPEVSLKGLARFFWKSSNEEREHAQKIIGFANKRGLKIELRTIEAPDFRYSVPSDILQTCKALEQTVLDNILSISEIAAKAGDGPIVQFFEEFIAEQVSSIAELNDLCVNCRRCGDDGLGLFLFDQKLL